MSGQQLDFWGSGADTLEEARRQVLRERAEGCACPCCGQLCKLYRRKLNGQMAAFLLALVRAQRTAPGAAWHHSRDFVGGAHKASSDGTYLVHWGLIEAGPRRALWRATPLGVQFAEGRCSVPRHAVLFDGELVRLDDSEQTDIRQALGDQFDYAELMRPSA